MYIISWIVLKWRLFCSLGYFREPFLPFRIFWGAISAGPPAAYPPRGVPSPGQKSAFARNARQLVIKTSMSATLSWHFPNLFQLSPCYYKQNNIFVECKRRKSGNSGTFTRRFRQIDGQLPGISAKYAPFPPISPAVVPESGSALYFRAISSEESPPVSG